MNIAGRLALWTACLLAPSADAKGATGAGEASGSSPNNMLIATISPSELLRSTPAASILESTYPTEELHRLFDDWRETFGRSYESDPPHEAALRKLTFLKNHAFIEEHNQAGHDWKLGHNEFSDLSQEEFMERMKLGKHSPGVFKPRGRSDGRLVSAGARSLRSLAADVEEDEFEGNAGEYDDLEVPDEKNWVEEGAVSSVKNQWFCGACWAFSAVGAIEGARAIKTGNLTDLSMQQLLDCDDTDMGCGGGLMNWAFQYDEDSVGLCSLNDYPYAYHRHWFWGCSRYAPYCTPIPDTRVSKYVNITETEEDLKAAIAIQPVSVAVMADGVSWQFYRDGIYSSPCEDPKTINHGVLAVGYGSDENGDYWLVKNSWGGYWGQGGYIKLGRNVGSESVGGSSCILTLASRPILKDEE